MGDIDKTDPSIGTKLSEQILSILRAKPDLKAKDIASALNVDRNLVNEALYGELRSQVVQDTQYRWKIKGVSEQREISEANKDKHTPLSKLCDYYLACLNYDNFDGQSIFASNKYGDPDYVELPELPMVSDNAADLFSNQNSHKLWQKVRRERSQLTLILGYPINIQKRKGRSGWEGYIIEPIFMFGFHEQEHSQHEFPTLTEDIPQLNFSSIKSLTGSEDSNIVDEVVSLSEELGLAERTIESPDLDELLLRLQQIRPEWNWKESPDVYNVRKNEPISQISESGIYNRAILFIAKRSPYTKGLETELAMLKKLSEIEYGKSSLGQWLNNEEVKNEIPQDMPLLEVIPLNTEQRQAVLHGLTRQLTVITGPPGTGKSQVVTSLLINTAWRGESVLFASKNNKAVDVVETRTNELGRRPVLLRLGKNEFQDRLVEYLISLLSASTSSKDEVIYQELLHIHEQIQQRFRSLDDDIDQIIKLRNSTDEADQILEGIRDKVTRDFVQDFRLQDPDQIRGNISKLENRITNAIKEQQPFFTRLLWNIFKSNRYRDLDEAAILFQSTAKALDVTLPPKITNDNNVRDWSKVLANVYQEFDYACKIHDYSAKLEKLSATKSLESVAHEHMELINRLSETSLSLWQTWLNLQPSRMSPDDRRVLGDYRSLLQMIVASNNDNKRVGSDILRRYQALFPKITKMLSCWAVTSLSARGRIPFEQGFFDLLVIDEASQCDIASALPLLFRAKRTVIIGDPKQLRHISGLPIKQDVHLLEKNELVEHYSRWGYSVNSLFDLASVLCSSSEEIINLRDHHRSHADIIEFSNHQFYDGSLRVATNYQKLKSLKGEQSAVRWLNVTGKVLRPTTGSAINEKEAESVVAELDRIVLKQGYKGSIGIVSPFRAHALRIRELINRNNRLDERLQGMDFLSSTVDGFQGDERDLIIFSPVISSGITTGALAFLRSRPNLFNVAITRAKAVLIVVGDKQAALDSGVEHLCKFAEYVNGLSCKNERNPLLEEEIGLDYPLVTHPERVSDWEKVFYKALFQAGLHPIPQYEVEKYDLDFALINGQHRLDIEVDGERYHSNWDGELCKRDQIRNRRLIELGWDVMRFWVYQIRDDPDNCILKVKKWVEAEKLTIETQETACLAQIDDLNSPLIAMPQVNIPEAKIPKSIKNASVITSNDKTRSHSRIDKDRFFRMSIHSPFPEELTPALPYLRRAYELEQEGQDSNAINQQLEMARQLDPDAYSYYIGRLAIMKENERNRES